MIRWLVQSIATDARLADGIAPSGLLNATESRHLTSFTSQKRRTDWLLGRWTAKHLVQSYFEETIGVSTSLQELTIANDADGAPYVIGPSNLAVEEAQLPAAHGNLPSPEDYASKLPLSLSISHSNGSAFCAVCEYGSTDSTPGIRTQIGVDIERIESRGTRFSEDFFSPDEIAQVRVAPTSLQDTLVTAIWSGKEATLKALRYGLRMDTRAVNCTIEPNVPLEWQPFSIELRGQLAGTEYSMLGWWRTLQDTQPGLSFVLTLVAASSNS